MNAMCHACIGGTNVRDDIRKLENGVHVVVGTPGRVFDMINRRALITKSIKIFVLDEADEMLSRGFKEQIYDVFKTLPQEVQVCFETLKKFKSAIGDQNVVLNFRLFYYRPLCPLTLWKSANVSCGTRLKFLLKRRSLPLKVSNNSLWEFNVRTGSWKRWLICTIH